MTFRVHRHFPVSLLAKSRSLCKHEKRRKLSRNVGVREQVLGKRQTSARFALGDVAVVAREHFLENGQHVLVIGSQLFDAMSAAHAKINIDLERKSSSAGAIHSRQSIFCRRTEEAKYSLMSTRSKDDDLQDEPDLALS